MLKVLLLIFIVMSLVVFAQTEEKIEPQETPKASKFDEFEKATNGNVKMRMDALFIELENNPAAQGYILNYGTDREIAKREKQIRGSINFRRYDASRLTMVRGGYREVIKTDLWLVSLGAEPPTHKTTWSKMNAAQINNNDSDVALPNVKLAYTIIQSLLQNQEALSDLLVLMAHVMDEDIVKAVTNTNEWEKYLESKRELENTKLQIEKFTEELKKMNIE